MSTSTGSSGSVVSVGRQRDELAVEGTFEERHLGEEEAERDQQRQQHDDEADRDPRVGAASRRRLSGAHRRRDERRQDPVLVERQVLVDVAVALEIDGQVPRPLLDDGVGLATAPPQEPVDDVVVVDVEPEDRLAFERVGLAVGVTVDRYDDARRPRPIRSGSP